MKKRRWLLLAMILILAAAIAVFPALAEENATVYESGDYKYILLADGTAEITRYTGKAESLSVPAQLDEYAVTSIGRGAFSDRYSLMTITLPDSLTSIEANPFISCNRLTQIKVSPDHPTFATINGVLFNKPEKKLICYPCAFTQESYAVPNGITSIGDMAFSNCKSLMSITLPDGLTSIGHSAFWECKALKIITLPDGLTSIGRWAFYDCLSLANITLPNNVMSIEDSAFWGCRTLKSITLPDGLTSIGDQAFNKCKSLTSITLPDSVASIGYRKFAHCNSLTSVTLPDSLTSIGDEAFDNCSDTLVFTVVRGSWAASWCKENGKEYTYTDSLDWLHN